MADEWKLPPPGLQGDYTGSCAVCMTGTDTGLAFVGPVEWALAGLSVLGVPDNQAEEMLRLAGFIDAEGLVSPGDVEVPIRVCASCAAGAGTGMAVGPVDFLPAYSPRKGLGRPENWRPETD